MDKKSFIGFLLIALIIIFLPKYYEWVNPEYAKNKAAKQQVVSDSVKTKMAAPVEIQITEPVEQALASTIPNTIDEKEYFIETDFLKVILSNKAGGTIKSMKLKEHYLIEDKDTSLVELVNQDKESGPYLSFINVEKGLKENLLVNFQLQNYENTKFKISGDESITLSFTLNYSNEDKIIRNITFYGNKYIVNYENDLTEVSQIIATENYQMSWAGGVTYTEKNIDDENRYNGAYAHTPADDIEKFKIKKTTKASTSFSGNTNWVALRSKYFSIAMVPEKSATGYELNGFGINKTFENAKKPKLIKFYGMSLSLPKYAKFNTTMYFGPLDQTQLKSVNEDLDNIMSFGAAIIKPISKAVLWLFTNIYKVIPNYGFVLIIFSILIKILLHPLTVKSTQSMKAMHKLQPLINDLKEKHKDDAQKINQETMKLYSEHGVNPMGGCLPLILQMPILFALFTVFRTTIQLRHAPFIFWITDLSAPDALFTFPFTIPFYGNTFNVLPILMVGAQIFMQRMSGQSQNPQQKQMAIMMPVMFFFMFQHFPSGLVLYYTLFNVLTIVQQQYFTPDPKPKTKKAKQGKSRLERMRELQQKRKQFK